MRFLRRHWPGGGKPAPWTADDEKALERDAEAAFGPGALARADERQSKFEDRFAALSLKAARQLADCYERKLPWDERQAALRAAGAPEPEIAHAVPAANPAISSGPTWCQIRYQGSSDSGEASIFDRTMWSQAIAAPLPTTIAPMAVTGVAFALGSQTRTASIARKALFMQCSTTVRMCAA